MMIFEGISQSQQVPITDIVTSFLSLICDKFYVRNREAECCVFDFVVHNVLNGYKWTIGCTPHRSQFLIPFS